MSFPVRKRRAHHRWKSFSQYLIRRGTLRHGQHHHQPLLLERETSSWTPNPCCGPRLLLLLHPEVHKEHVFFTLWINWNGSLCTVNRKEAGTSAKQSLERWSASGRASAPVLPLTLMTQCGRSSSRGLTPPQRRAVTVKEMGGTTLAWCSRKPPAWAPMMRVSSRISPE